MKKLILAIFAIIPLGLAAQQTGFDKLSKKYETQKGFTIVNLEGNVLDGVLSFLKDLDDDPYEDYDYDYEYYDYGDGEDSDGYEIIDLYYEPDGSNEEPDITQACAGCESYDPSCCDGKCDADHPIVELVCSLPDQIIFSDFDEDDDIVLVPIEEDNQEDYVYDWEYPDYYDDDDDYDYYDYYSYRNRYYEYLTEYIQTLSYFKAIMCEIPSKKFSKDLNKTVINSKPYKLVFSSQNEYKDIRFYVIDDDGNGRHEVLIIIGDDGEYIVVNYAGQGDFSMIMEALNKFL